MLVKNTIITLMAVAPAFAIPVPGPEKITGAVKSTGAVAATTKSTVPTTAKVSKAAVTTANNKVKADMASEKTLRKELAGLDSKLALDKTAAKQLSKQERAQEKSDAKTSKAKLTSSTGKHTTKVSTKESKLSTGKHTTKASTKESKLSTGKHTTKLSTKESKLSTGRAHLGTTKNKNNLRISTTGARGTTRTRHSVTPGSARTSHSLTPGSARTTHSLTPGSARTNPWSGISRSAVGSAQSPFFGGYSPFQSPGYSPYPNGMSDETVSFTPSAGGGYTEKISFGRPQQISRRAITPVTPVTPSASLTPISPQTPHRKSRKSALHMHNLAEAMQLTNLLVEAEKVVNGLEEQMNMPPTAFANLKRKSKAKRPTTPTTPATPATPPPVRST